MWIVLTTTYQKNSQSSVISFCEIQTPKISTSSISSLLSLSFTRFIHIYWLALSYTAAVIKIFSFVHCIWFLLRLIFLFIHLHVIIHAILTLHIQWKLLASFLASLHLLFAFITHVLLFLQQCFDLSFTQRKTFWLPTVIIACQIFISWVLLKRVHFQNNWLAFNYLLGDSWAFDIIYLPVIFASCICHILILLSLHFLCVPQFQFSTD